MVGFGMGSQLHGVVEVVDNAELFLGTSVGLRRHGLLGEGKRKS